MSRTPRLVGTGPLVYPSGREVATLDSFATLDVNGYYRALGMTGWLGPVSSGMIRRHFRDPSQWSSPWLTYVVSTLLNRDFREQYHRATNTVMDDYIIEATRRRMSGIIADQRRRGFDDQQIDELLRRALPPQEDEDSSPEILDTEGVVHKDRGEEDEPAFRYSYWLWGDDTPRAESLIQWQSHLADALHRRDLKIQVTLGWGTFLSWDVEYSSDGTYVIVCGINGPSSEAAEEAATLIWHHQESLTNPTSHTLTNSSQEKRSFA